MVSGSDDVHSGLQQFLGQPGRDAAPGGGVFPIDHDKVRSVRFPESGERMLQGGASRFSDHIAYK